MKWLMEHGVEFEDRHIVENNPTAEELKDLIDDKEREMRETLLTVYNALKEKGYNPVSQIVGYILSEDPTYITTHHNARSLIRRIDRDELLEELVQFYLSNNV